MYCGASKYSDGDGGKDYDYDQISHSMTRQNCISTCETRSKTYNNINGVAVSANSQFGECWCLKNVKGWKSDSRYEACIFTYE